MRDPLKPRNIINPPDPTTNPVTKLHNGEMGVGGPDFQFPPSIFLDDNGDAITNDADRDDKREDYCKENYKGSRSLGDGENYVGFSWNDLWGGDPAFGSGGGGCQLFTSDHLNSDGVPTNNGNGMWDTYYLNIPTNHTYYGLSSKAIAFAKALNNATEITDDTSILQSALTSVLSDGTSETLAAALAAAAAATIDTTAAAIDTTPLTTALTNAITDRYQVLPQ